MKRIFTTLMLSSLVSAVSAEEIRSVTVWYDSDRALVTKDIEFYENVDVQFFDLSLQRKAEARINSDLKEQGLQFTNSQKRNIEISKDAMREYVYSKEFEIVQSQLKALGYGLSIAAHHRIEKVPAILINDQYLVYGVNSMNKAIGIFNREVK